MNEALFDNEESRVDFTKFFNDSEIRQKVERLKRVKVASLVALVTLLVLICVLFGWMLFAGGSEQLDKSNGNETLGEMQEFLNSTEAIITSTTSTTTLPITTLPTIIPTTPRDHELEHRRQFIRNMALSAWQAYSKYSWGDEALEPEAKTPYVGTFGPRSGLTLIASMTTLWTMGLASEFAKGKSWIENKFDFTAINHDVMVHDAMTCYVASLLSCYALTKDRMFVDKAIQVANVMEPAFRTGTGIPYEDVNPHTGIETDNQPYLSYMSGFQMEYNHLSEVSGDKKYRDRIVKILGELQKIEKPRGLYSRMINIMGSWAGTRESSLFTLGRDFYYSLVRSYLQSNGNSSQPLLMYKEALDAAEKSKLFDSSSEYDFYSRKCEINSKPCTVQEMEMSGCYLGAMLSLGAWALERDLRNSSLDQNQRRAELYRIFRHKELAERLTETCHKVSVRTETGLPAQTFNFENSANSGGYNLTPELAESYFILWRLTKDVKYRNQAWEFAQAIERICRSESGGYARLQNVNEVPAHKVDHQPSIFLSATLKYLYLTFTDDSEFPLEQWVFNARGQPLPVAPIGMSASSSNSLVKELDLLLP